jgi:sec-independent protein translocase protein TatB
MFDISWGKLVIIGVVALLVIGPKELPGVLRMVGQWMGKMRRMAAEFQGQFQEAMREAEMADLKKQFDDTAATFNSAIDPSGMKADFEKMMDPAPASSTAATPDPSAPPPASDPAAPAAPSDPAASGAAPVAPAVDLNVPMPEPLPPVTEADFKPLPAAPAPEPAVPPASPSTATAPAPSSAEGGKAA